MKFIASFLLSLVWLVVVFIGLFAVAIMLSPLHKWDGKTTWFGNYLYGRAGNSHMPPNPTIFDQWWFLAIRNPVSNFGKKVISVRADRSWPWLVDCHLFGVFYLMYGWKNPVDGFRTFVFRPWKHKE